MALFWACQALPRCLGHRVHALHHAATHSQRELSRVSPSWRLHSLLPRALGGRPCHPRLAPTRPSPTRPSPIGFSAEATLRQAREALRQGHGPHGCLLIGNPGQQCLTLRPPTAYTAREGAQHTECSCPAQPSSPSDRRLGMLPACPPTAADQERTPRVGGAKAVRVWAPWRDSELPAVNQLQCPGPDSPQHPSKRSEALGCPTWCPDGWGRPGHWPPRLRRLQGCPAWLGLPSHDRSCPGAGLLLTRACL